MVEVGRGLCSVRMEYECEIVLKKLSAEDRMQWQLYIGSCNGQAVVDTNPRFITSDSKQRSDCDSRYQDPSAHVISKNMVSMVQKSEWPILSQTWQNLHGQLQRDIFRYWKRSRRKTYIRSRSTQGRAPRNVHLLRHCKLSPAINQL